MKTAEGSLQLRRDGFAEFCRAGGTALIRREVLSLRVCKGDSGFQAARSGRESEVFQHHGSGQQGGRGI